MSSDDTLKDADWMAQALKLAEEALPVDVPVGALIVNRENQVIATGFNTRERDTNPLGHAELNALKLAAQQKGDWRLSDCTVYVTLEPCPMCAAALLQSRIGRIVFGAADPIQGALGSALNLATLYTNPLEITGGVSETKCQAQLQAFFNARRAN